MAMWIRHLQLTDFAGISQADVALEPGLNVLHGPNELGKSTLAKAIRAALLLQPTAKAAESLHTWNLDARPNVALTLEEKVGHVWRVSKDFGKPGKAQLDWSKDGQAFSPDSKAGAVDGKLRDDLLRWGVPSPGGKGGKKGMPASFITTALLGDQSDIEAILDTGLEDDPSESGRDRLTEALQALAEDPRFKQVLGLAQEKADEAFAPAGKRKMGKTAPWSKLLAERIAAKQRERDSRQQVEQSEAARKRVRELNQRLLEAEAEAEQATATLKATQMRGAAKQALSQAENRMQEAVEQVRALEQKQAAVAATGKEVAALGEAQTAAERAVLEAEPPAKEAGDRVLQLASGDAEQGRQLRLQEAQNKRLHLQQQVTDLAAKVKQAQALAAGEKAVAAKAAEVDKQTATLAEQRDLLAEAHSATERDKAQLAQLAKERDCARYRVALAKVEKCEKDLAAMREQGAKAKASTEQAEAKRAEAKALQAPAEAELKQLRQLDEERRVARAKLAVGLTVDFTPERAGRAEATIDGETRQRQYTAGERLAYQAERELQLTLDGIGIVEVRGGGRDRQREAQAAMDRWQAEAAPIFARAGLDPLEGLDALIAKSELAAGLTEQAAKLDSEAMQARSRSEGIDDAEHAAAVASAEAEKFRTAITKWLQTGVSLDDAVRTTDDTRSEAIIAEESRTLQERLNERDTLCAKLETKLELGDAALATAKQDLDSAQRELAKSMPKDEDWRRLLAEGDAEQRKLADDLKTQDSTIDAIRAEATTEAEQAKAEQTRLETELATKCKERDALTQRLQTKMNQLEGLRGEAKVLKTGTKELDIDALQAARNDQLAQLEALPATDSDLSADELEREARHAKAAAESARIELATAQGELSKTGGQSIEEQANAAKEALAAIDRREHELDVEYGAWKLLRDTLAEAEKEDAAHLGDALVKPVSERMNELTNGRYEEVGIGPQLGATGISLGGDERAFTDVSVGTREQIALLLRLSIAEALESFLILDDHLTQSDPVRMAWIRDLLGRAAKNIQVVVMTCHPDAYITGHEHGVDLTQCITRHDST